jgi:hypothetical protein
MAAIRGAGGNCPCPVCLIPKDKQDDLAIVSRYARRTTQSMKAAWKAAKALRTAAEREDLLKALGLRDVNVRVIVSWFQTIAHISQ